MRPFIVILCTLLIGFQTCYPGLTGIYFHFNKQYIQENLCINKNLNGLPEVSCKGKCHLRKMIELGADGAFTDNTENENNKGPKLQQSAEDIVLFCQQNYPIYYIESFDFTSIDVIKSASSRPYHNLTTQIYRSAIFVPPNLALS